jgi:hypothetical protein
VSLVGRMPCVLHLLLVVERCRRSRRFINGQLEKKSDKFFEFAGRESYHTSSCY